MKRLLLLVMVFGAIVFSSMATVPIPITARTKNNSGSTRGKAPLYLPIEVSYDEENRTLEVVCNTSVDGEVFIYNAFDECIDYSGCVNTVLYIPENCSYPFSIKIESEFWIAEGIVESEH